MGLKKEFLFKKRSSSCQKIIQYQEEEGNKINKNKSRSTRGLW